MAAMELREYQQEALDRIERAAARGVRRQLGVAATGLGKTIIFCALAERMAVRTLVIAHRDELIEQAAAKVREVWPGVDVGVVKGDRDEVHATVVVASVQTLSRPNRLARLLAPTVLDDAPQFGLVVIDEAHHSAAKSYRALIHGLRCDEPDGPLLLGVTATPDRGDGKGLDDLFDEITFSYDIRWGIAQRWLSDLRGKRVRLAADFAALKVTAGDYNQGQAGQMLEDADAPAVIVRAWQRFAPGRRTLVFTPTVELAKSVTAAFVAAGVRAASVDGAMPLEERRAVLAAYSAGDIDVVSNCAVLTEGYDEPRTDCVVMARPTKSRALYTQCLDTETEVLTMRGFLGPDDIRDDDLVAAFMPGDGTIGWSPILSRVDRPLGPGEQMVGIESPRMSIRVTGGHRMVHATRSGRAHNWSGWKVRPAEELLGMSDGWRVPVSGVQRSAGVDLSDDELRFLGWFMTDGHLNSRTNTISIGQAEHQPHHEAIRSCLEGCGFKYGVYVERPGRSQWNETSRLVKYTVSKGQPRGTGKHLRGWGALEPYVGKDFPEPLDAMDRRQLGVLLGAMHLGDGSKQLGQSWTRRSYHLAMGGNTVMSERLQSLCVRRGYRAALARSADGQITLHIKEQTAAAMGGAKAADRPSLAIVESQPAERVWCVETEPGTLIARRRGKVVVLGNCVGRGTRVHPEKQDCLVIDVVGASDVHDLVTVPSLFGIERPEKVWDAAVGATVMGVLRDQVETHEREGRLLAAEARLFDKVRDLGKMAWVTVHAPGAQRRYELSMGRAKGELVLLEVQPDRWRAGWRDGDGVKRVLIDDVSLELAQGVAEDLCRKKGAANVASTDARWRKARPSRKQRDAAKKFGIDLPVGCTKGDASDLLGAHLARLRARKRTPAT